MDDIQESLLMEVLLRLPLVALYRFKVVCKNWLSLISSPYFLHQYASRGWMSPRWAFVSRKKYDFSERYPVQAHELLIDLHCGDLKCPIPNGSNDDLLTSTYRIMGVSNGLVLYKWSMGDSRNHQHGMNWGVCNPVTKQRVALPPCISKHHFADSCGFLTRMDDGFVTSFTVVKYAERRSRFEVFLSETGEWKPSHVYNRPAWFYRTPTDLGGILHWILVSFNGIVAYDPHRNNYRDALRVIPLPADSRRSRIGMCGTHDGHLRFLQSTKVTLSVWVLNNYSCGDNWLLQHRTTNTNILKVVHDELCKTLGNKIKLQPISFHPFDPDVVYLRCDHVFFSYNMREGKSQVLKTSRALRNERGYYQWRRAFCLVIPPLPPSLPSSTPRE